MNDSFTNLENYKKSDLDYKRNIFNADLLKILLLLEHIKSERNISNSEKPVYNYEPGIESNISEEQYLEYNYELLLRIKNDLIQLLKL